jgi:peptidyl-prolyl cis-trans isomerase C
MNDGPRRPGLAQRWLHAPLLHFFLIGAVLYGVGNALRPEPETKVFVSLGDVASASEEWRRATGRSPNPEELARLIDQFVDEDILVRLARLLGWDRSDSVIQFRLIRNLRFLDPESERSDAELLDQAYEMGMEQSDIGVRRRLLERMKLAIAASARRKQPQRPELEAYWAQNPQDFERPPRLRASHVFLSRDRRGDELRDDATRLLEELRSSAIPPDRGVLLGDPLLVPAHLPLLSEQGLSLRLGPDFAASTFELNQDAQWSGPIDSSYGAHLVWIHERLPMEIVPLDEVEARVRSALLREQEGRLMRETVAQLREGVVVEVEQGSGSSDERPAGSKVRTP